MRAHRYYCSMTPLLCCHTYIDNALRQYLVLFFDSIAQADVRVELQADEGVDDAALNVVNSVLEFIDSNPPKWQQWKEKAQQAGIDWA